jgi:hypothetical protein
MLGVHWARNFLPPGHAGTSPDLTWHGGTVMPSAAVTAVFWGPSWSKATFVGDKIVGLDSWYTGVTGSSYAVTSDEYTGTNGQVGSTVSYAGHLIDTSTVSRNVSRSVTATLNEVCKVIKTPVSNGYYPVYVDTRRGGAGFCAWHSYGSCSGVPVQFGFFFNLDGDAGCDPADTSGLHSQGLAALANVTGHELSEARSDPRNGGWLDSSGQENADKCAWTFGTPLLTFSNGSQWKIQGNWSNAAYDGSPQTGYPNSSGQHGCLDGGIFK